MKLSCFKLLAVCFTLFNTSPCHSQNNLKYFPRNYEYSRTRFIQEAQPFLQAYSAQKPTLGKFAVGTEGLTVDYLYIPAQQAKKSLVVITSGNHGAEAYTGSALQSLFMNEVLKTLNLKNTGVLLIHALNPWGFQHHRRGTKNNVNLNRNFDIDPALFSVKNPEYMKLKEFLEPVREVRSSHSFPSKRIFWQMMVKKDVTAQSLTEAISKGQYESPLGINYGGSKFETQTVDVVQLLHDTAKPYPAVLNIDLHTGLGETNVLHVMTQKNMNEISKKKQDQLLKADESCYYQITPPGAEGFYETYGDYTNIIRKLFPEDDRVAIEITAEFGTLGNGLIAKTKSLNRLILENQGYHYGYQNDTVKKNVERKYLEMFFPSDEEWRKKALINGKYLLDVVVKRFIEQNS